jgi:uncharacterized membrane protein
MYEFLLTVHVLAAVIWVGAATRLHPALDPAGERTATVNTVELTILLLVIVAMTTKPG